jgi:hypothetical protein
VHDLSIIELKLRQSQTEGCARYWARQLVQAQWEAGLIPVAHLSNDIFTEIANQAVEQYWSNKP